MLSETYHLYMAFKNERTNISSICFKNQSDNKTFRCFVDFLPESKQYNDTKFNIGNCPL